MSLKWTLLVTSYFILVNQALHSIVSGYWRNVCAVHTHLKIKSLKIIVCQMCPLKFQGLGHWQSSETCYMEIIPHQLEQNSLHVSPNAKLHRGQGDSLAQQFSKHGPWSRRVPRHFQGTERSNYLLNNTNVICLFNPHSLVSVQCRFPEAPGHPTSQQNARRGRWGRELWECPTPLISLTFWDIE